ncbi:hypothetical protein [Leucobacter denitrificans]|uniref:Uncharacterized protein n=1 Tax=Leucobacter denitrificans TaxID=683042 RepID=A0A7G9S721_9MICO|nr:hypothetical protein [Leucobacter denitrificans]QNN63646.1 hypothetical protein H9L06_04920 [Leucobacter denitrificans]
MASETQQTVELQRSVRYGRLLIGGAILGGALGALITLFFPIPEGALYTMRQIAGFMLLIGAVIGLAIGGVLSLVLTAVAKRKRGTAVVDHVVAHEVPAATETPEAPEVPESESAQEVNDTK